MAEPSLLCVNCARPPPPHRRTWGRCTVCIERDLPSTYYCGEECMNAHWPKHQQYHKVQKQWAKQDREGTGPGRSRLLAEAAAQYAVRTGDEFDKRGAAAMALNAEDDLHAAVKAWRKMINEWPHRPQPYDNLALVMFRSSRFVESAAMYLKAMELYEDGTEHWAVSAAEAFDLLKHPVCDEVPKPDWWNDKALMALSARVVAVAPDGHQPRSMRARVLCGDALSEVPWNVGPRTAAEIKEAAMWYWRAARVSHGPVDTQRDEQLASACDEYADLLLAKEEVEAAEALIAAEEKALAKDAKEMFARAAAEARALAAAEELLAEEAKEKKQAVTSTIASKAKGKGKKGKGKR